MATSYLFLADGFEEIEALAVVDMLRRAGIDVETVSITEQTSVSGAHGIKVEADTVISKANLGDAQWLICPGGLPGSTNLAGCKALTDALKAQEAKGGKIAAICAAPGVVLAPLGILEGKEATCYPSFEQYFTEGTSYRDDVPVCVSDNVITACGPGVTMKFASAIIASTLDEATAQRVCSEMMIHRL